MPERDERTFDNPLKKRGWHTALYYLAEHVRVLSQGNVNHKMLYAHIGTKGNYINHENPLIRKRTAAALSRMLHSPRYAEDLRARYQKDDSVFETASRWLLERLREESGLVDAELAAYLAGPLLRDVERGLENERASGRGDFNIIRALNEMDSLLSWSEAALEDHAERFVTIASSLLYLIAYGHLEKGLVYDLADETPLTLRVQGGAACGPRCEDCACFIKYVDGDHGAVSDVWLIDGSRPFSIGRYTDCDVIETNRYVSRLHCAVRRGEDGWELKDMGSRHGTVVMERDGTVVFDSRRHTDTGWCALRFGQRIVLAESSRYWFAAVSEEGRSAMAELDLRGYPSMRASQNADDETRNLG